jgi:glycosyltransferase involved in cell wall biosynthesis
MARILFVTQTAHSWGGVEAWLEYLAAALGIEHEVTIGLVRGRRFHDPGRYRPSAPSIEIPALTGTVEGRVRALSRAVEATRAEVVIPVNIADVLEATRRLKAEGSTARLLYPLHGLAAGYFLDARQFRGIIDRAVATNRLSERGLIEISRLSPERVSCGVVGARAAEGEPRFESPSPLRLIYVGRLTQEQKRVRDLIAVCDRLDGQDVAYALDIAGGGDEEPALRAALGDRSHVRFFGVLSSAELYARIYPGAAALVLLSDWETGPIVAWEAMRHGATVVTTEYLGLRAERRLIHEENALIAPIGDTVALSDAIRRLADDASLLGKLRRAAYATAERECTIERSVAEWTGEIERCLSAEAATDVREVELPPTEGRLDRWLGVRRAESIRARMHLGMRHGEPGGEWPHTYHHAHPDSAAIDAKLKELDA